MLLKCTVESNSTAQWGFEWDKPKTVLTLNPRHVVSNDSYFITAVTREDAGSYRCKAGQISSQPVELIVSGEQLQHLLCCVLFVCPNLLAGLTKIKIIMFKILKLIKKTNFYKGKHYANFYIQESLDCLQFKIILIYHLLGLSATLQFN